MAAQAVTTRRKIRGLGLGLAHNPYLPGDIEEEKEGGRKGSRRGEKERDGGRGGGDKSSNTTGWRETIEMK